MAIYELMYRKSVREIKLRLFKPHFFPSTVTYVIVIANVEIYYECTYFVMQELGADDVQCSPPKAWRNIENNALSSLH